MAKRLRLLSIDAETFWDPANDYTLSKMTTEAYVRDPRFELIGMSVSIDQKPPVWLEEWQFRTFINSIDPSTIACSAHHAHFDGLILSHHYGFRPARWLDTLSMSRAIHGNRIGNSLEALLVHYGLKPKGDYVTQAKGMHRRDFTPEQFKQYGDYSNNDNVGHQNLLRIFLPQFTADELDQQDLTVRMFTEPVLVLNERVLNECLVYERERKATLLYKAGLTPSPDPAEADRETAKKALGSPEKFAALLADLGVDAPMKPNPAGDKMIYAFAKTDPAFQELLEHPDPDVRIICEARQAIKSTTNETRTMRMLRMGAGGRACPVYLKYAGAHTWRWSGGDGVNWQNFERTNKKNPKKGMIRQAVEAPPGFVMCVADSSQIQARLTAWLAGHIVLLDKFRNKVDIYSEFATEAYGRKIDRKKVAEDEVPGQVGKVCVLGLGFEMGWYKLAGELLKGALGTDPVQFRREDLAKMNIDPSRFLANPRNVQRVVEMPSRLPIDERLIHCAVASHLVDIYRRDNREIKVLWRFAEDMVQRLIDKRYGPCFYLGCMTAIEGGFRGPDGTVLKYPHLTKSEAGFSYLSGRNRRTGLYGGKIVENIIQYLERVIMARFALRLKREYLDVRCPGRGKIAWLSHDEVVAVVPEELGADCYANMIQKLNEPPAWANGLPLAAEGGFGRVYGEIK